MSGKFWDKAWSLVEGCTPVSAGCDNCWLAALANRFAREVEPGHSSGILTDEAGVFNGTVIFRSDRLDLPMRTKKPTVFAVWSDLYHEAVTPFQLGQVCAVFEECRQHTFLVITKRPERAVKFALPLPNVYHLVTVENQKMADKRIPHALNIPGKVGLLIEPCLSSIVNFMEPHISFVILGGETGKNARPMHPDNARSVRDQCAAAGVMFYFKSNGEWGVTGVDEVPPDTPDFSRWVCSSSTDRKSVGKACYRAFTGRIIPSGPLVGWKETYRLERIGHKRAGRLLDGREYNELPWRKS